MDRRTLLSFIATFVCSTVAGCTFGNSIPPGSLIISNDQDHEHVVTVTITKVSNFHDDLPPRPHDAPAPTTTPRWEREYSFEVSAGGNIEEPGLISEPGAFYVDASLESGETAATWLGLYPAGSDGQQVAEAIIAVDIYEDGRVIISTPVDE